MAETQTHHPEIGSQRAFNFFVATHPNNEKGPGRHRATNEKPRHEAQAERRSWRERAAAARRLGGRAVEGVRKVADRALYGKSITEQADQSMAAYDKAVRQGVSPQEFFADGGSDKNIAPAVITEPRAANHAEKVSPWFATKADRESGRVVTTTNGEAFDSIVSRAEELEAPDIAATVIPEPADNDDLDLPAVPAVYGRRGSSTSDERSRHNSYGRHALNPYEERRRYVGVHAAEPDEVKVGRHEQ